MMGEQQREQDRLPHRQRPIAVRLNRWCGRSSSGNRTGFPTGRLHHDEPARGSRVGGDARTEQEGQSDKPFEPPVSSAEHKQPPERRGRDREKPMDNDVQIRVLGNRCI